MGGILVAVWTFFFILHTVSRAAKEIVTWVPFIVLTKTRGTRCLSLAGDEVDIRGGWSRRRWEWFGAGFGVGKLVGS